MDRDELVVYTVGNMAHFINDKLAGGTPDHPIIAKLNHEDLRTIRAMALTVYMSAMPGHTTLSGPEELMPLMRSDWELLMAAWDEAGGTVEG